MNSAKWWTDILYLNSMTREEMQGYIQQIQDEATDDKQQQRITQAYNRGFERGREVG